MSSSPWLTYLALARPSATRQPSASAMELHVRWSGLSSRVAIGLTWQHPKCELIRIERRSDQSLLQILESLMLHSIQSSSLRRLRYSSGLYAPGRSTAGWAGEPPRGHQRELLGPAHTPNTLLRP